MYAWVLHIMFWRGNRTVYIIQDAGALQAWTVAQGFLFLVLNPSLLFSALFLIIPYILSFALCLPLHWHFYTTTYVNSKLCSLRGNSLSSATVLPTNLVLWNPSLGLCSKLSFLLHWIMQHYQKLCHSLLTLLSGILLQIPSSTDMSTEPSNTLLIISLYS